MMLQPAAAAADHRDLDLSGHGASIHRVSKAVFYCEECGSKTTTIVTVSVRVYIRTKPTDNPSQPSENDAIAPPDLPDKKIDVFQSDNDDEDKDKDEDMDDDDDNERPAASAIQPVALSTTPTVVSGWYLADLLGEEITDKLWRALRGNEGNLRRFKHLFFKRFKRMFVYPPYGSGERGYWVNIICYLDPVNDPYVADLLAWANAQLPLGSPCPPLPPYPSPRETRPRPADAPAFFGDLFDLPEWTAPYWDAMIAEVENEILMRPGFFHAAPRISRYADALPDEVVRQFLRRHDPSRPCPWLTYFGNLQVLFDGGNPVGQFPVLKTMLMGRAFKHRGLAALSETVFVVVYRIVAHMVAQLADSYSRLQLRHFQFRMQVERNWMFV
jgi:hypothetical protein